jgi:hypothetical protein
MSMTVNITFSGDVIVYFKDAVWNFIMITDKDHVAQMSYSSLQPFPNGLRTPGQKFRKLSLNSKFLSATNSVSEGPQYNNILNMSASYLHGVDASGKSNISVGQASGQQREIIHLTFETGQIDGDSLLNDYWIEDLSTGKVANVGKATAQQVKLTFTIDKGRDAVLTLDDDGSSSTLQSWIYDPAGLQLTFDNGCHATGNRADFLHFYDWVYDIRDGQMFLAGKPGTGAMAVESLQGNCDPMMIDPPPLP